MAPVAGLHQTSLAFKDEVNVFRRTLMHMGVPGSSRWYRLSGTEKTQLRDVLYFRRRPDVGSETFKSFVHRFADHISESGKVTELRTQVYLPWNKLTWNTPDVAHDNPKEHQLHASLIMGFPDEDTRRHFYDVTAQKWNTEIEKYASAVHSYRITETIP